MVNSLEIWHEKRQPIQVQENLLCFLQTKIWSILWNCWRGPAVMHWLSSIVNITKQQRERERESCDRATVIFTCLGKNFYYLLLNFNDLIIMIYYYLLMFILIYYYFSLFIIINYYLFYLVIFIIIYYSLLIHIIIYDYLLLFLWFIIIYYYILLFIIVYY